MALKCPASQFLFWNGSTEVTSIATQRSRRSHDEATAMTGKVNLSIFIIFVYCSTIAKMFCIQIML